MLRLRRHAMASAPPQPTAARWPLADILRDEDYRHRLRLTRGQAHDFFAPWASSPRDLLTQRRHWLTTDPDRYAPFHDSATTRAAVDELAEVAGPWTSQPGHAEGPAATTPTDPGSRWLALGSVLEPDLVLLAQDAGEFRMIAGAVCFPSGWAPEQKLGRSLGAIHAPVPSLNESLGASLAEFLARLAPGPTWLRANWGLTASPEWNQHPARALPRLAPPPTLATTFLRLEHQALLLLPRTRALLFGIRVEHVPLTDLAAQPPLAAALARALRSMPEPMAQYKGLASVRHSLAAALDVLPPHERAG